MNVITILCDTFRRDHCGPYNHGRPLNQCWSDQQPDWIVPTPNIDRLAARGTTFDNCWCGSTPCMPARRDIYTGRYEFLERGWGPLEDDDKDLPRQVSGPPNESMQWSKKQGYRVSELITDHFHLWEQGAGNYHMGYSGFEFVRGHEADSWKTDPVDFFSPEVNRLTKLERHFRNKHLTQNSEADTFPAQIFTQASDWLKRNKAHENFYLHLDCFSPHEPWDPPEELVKMFDPEGYIEDWPAVAAYDYWKNHYDKRTVRNLQARYAAKAVLVDRWLGKMLDTMDELDLWQNTLVVFTTDHGTYNGDHGRMGKLQTHEHDAVGHIPMIMCHPALAHGQRRDQLVQLVDLYPTTLASVERPLPDMPDGKPLHGVNLLPILEDDSATTRDFAIAGMYGKSVTITDGKWILHQSPPDPSEEGNQPLYWHGHPLSRFIPGYKLGPVVDGKRAARCSLWNTPTWLSDKEADPNELTNLADSEPEQLKRMQKALRQKLTELKAPPEQAQRLGLDQN